MMTKRCLGGIGALWASALLTACGGSGGSGGTPTPPPPPPPAPAPAPYTLTPSTAKGSFVAGYPQSISLSAKQTVAFVGVAYIQVSADAAVIHSPISAVPNTDGTVTITIQPLASLAPGHYTGNFTVDVCADANCASPLAGAPFKVPYDFTAISPNGGATAYNLSTLSALPGATDWGMFQGNAAHTGFVPVTLQPSAFNRRWRWDAGSNNGMQWEPSVITTGAGMFYVSNGPDYDSQQAGHALFAYKEDDGSLVWQHSFGDLAFPTTNPPAFSGGRVFIAAGSQESTNMFAFDAATGTLDFKSQMASQWEHYFAPTIFNGAVYTDGGEYGGMYAFDAAGGTQKFYVGAAQYDGWTPAVDATHAYSYTAGNLGIYDNQSGALIANIADPNFSWNGYTSDIAPVLGAANTVYAGNLSNKTSNAIANFDTLNDVVRWSVHGAFSGNPAYAAGTLFAANNAPVELVAYNEADGSQQWAWTPPAADGSFVSDVLVTSNLVFVSTAANTYAIDRGTHQAVWSDASSGSLALSANGILYIKGAYSIVAINLH